MTGLIKNPSGSPVDFSKLGIQPNICLEAVVPFFCLGYLRISAYSQAVIRADTLCLCLSYGWKTVGGNQASSNDYQKRQTSLFTLMRKHFF